MDRRSFLKTGGLSLVAVTLLGQGVYAIAGGTASSSCLPTTADILGPFYRANAPFRSNLTVPGDTGNPLLFKGQVLNANCDPIPGAVVDVWQAAQNGAYDNSSPAFNYRGRQQTDLNGSYSFSSIEPGWYLNGSQYRPRHIHFRVTAPGYTELITQLYFQNDPYIAADPWASTPAAQLRIVPITTVNGTPTADFQITLHGTPTGLQHTGQNVPVKVLQNPFQSQLGFSSPDEPLLHFELFNAQGQLVAREYNIHKTALQLPAGGLANGVYFARLQTLQNIYVLQVLKQ